jgi:hypothetical protein
MRVAFSFAVYGRVKESRGEAALGGLRRGRLSVRVLRRRGMPHRRVIAAEDRRPGPAPSRQASANNAFAASAFQLACASSFDLHSTLGASI